MLANLETSARPELIVFPGTYTALSFLPAFAWTLVMRRRFGDRALQPRPG